MKIYCIVEREGGEHDAHWIIDAIDEWTIDEWNGAYPTEFQKKLDDDPVNRAVLIVEVPDGAMTDAFPLPPVVKGKVVDG